MIDWLPNGLIAHNLPPPVGLIKCDTVLDIGAGLRPMQWYKPPRHLCVEPHEPYAQRLAAAGFVVQVSTAREFLAPMTSGLYEAIYLLDVIEHMTLGEGCEVIKLAIGAGARQVVVFTPLGFLEQHGDAWELGGDEWQEHRSGWTPEDFPGWRIELFGRGFFATWTAPTQT